MRLDHFGLLAPIYDHFVPTPDLSRLRAVLELQPSDRLLDVGGGTGRISAHLTADADATWIVDASRPMLRRALDSDLRLCQGPVEALPLRDHSFDKIIAVDSFHHFQDQRLAAQEMLRVLRPGGRLVVEEPNVRHFTVKLVALGEKLALMRSHFRRSEELRALFQRDDTAIETLEEGFTYWIVIDKGHQR